MAMAGVMCLTTVGPTVPVRFYTQADESLGSPSSQDPMMTVDGLMHSMLFHFDFQLSQHWQSSSAPFCIRCGCSFLRPHLLPQMYSGLEIYSCAASFEMTTYYNLHFESF